ncbi:ATP-binding protein [Oxalobacteraceae bacterium A2-2]
MELFAVNSEVAQWEAALAPLRGPARLSVLLPLAWHLRQRDTARACRLADEAGQLLTAAGFSDERRLRMAARLQLVHATAAWLAGQLERAAQLATDAFDVLCGQGVHSGCADAHWLLAWIAIDRGDHEGCDRELRAMAAIAREGGDGQRATIAEAVQARFAVLRDPATASAQWGNRFGTGAGRHPGVTVWINDFLALAASLGGDISSAAGHYLAAHEAALETGQLRAAVTVATNMGESFAMLNAHDAALEWMQSALLLARRAGWPPTLGVSLTQTADAQRRLGRHDAAEELLQEALAILAPLPGGRAYAMALYCLGDLSLDRGLHQRALDAFLRLQERADALRQSDLQAVAQRGRAHALCLLDRPHQALQAATLAAHLAAQASAVLHVAALRVLALVHDRHPLPPPPAMTAHSATLHYLQQALAVAATIKDYTAPPELFDALAQEYARLGDHALAYATARRAAAARAATHSQEATSRAVAMQVHHRSERARAEGQHHRELAAAEARRAAVLQQTSDTLQHLSAIGQEITAHLDAAAVFGTLDRHVHALLPADTFAIYLCDNRGGPLVRAFGVEDGKPLAANTIALDHPHAHAARCLSQRREIVVEHAPGDTVRPITPQSLPSMSALFVPLLAGERALGVMTVQSMRLQAYGERERLIFRTLCAYGAIALDNADAYRQLKDAQTQLVAQEKLAALGALMAGVAHELNTPIGNSLLIASTLLEKTEALQARLNGPGLRRSELAAYVEDAATASGLVMRGLHSAAELVNSFKQVAMDRTTEQRRVYNLRQVAHEVIATMMNRVRAGGHQIDAELPDSLLLDGYPGPFGQVLANFINNALLHAFDRDSAGRMRLTAEPAGPERIRVVFTDNGRGIAPEHLSRIFDPFFTTKLGQGGSGLGLSISYNIVTALLGGQISVDSGPQGTRFTLELPLSAPRHEVPASQIYH